VNVADVERAASFLATHAVLLLGVGIIAALLSVAAIAGAVRLAGRFRRPLIAVVSALLEWLRQFDSIRSLLSRSVTLVPGAYLGLHLALGLVGVAAIAAFVALAQDAIAGGSIGAFDAAFASALYAERRPPWNTVFSAISSLGTGLALSVVTLVVGVLLIRDGQKVLAIWWFAAQAGGGLLNTSLKAAFGRARPEFADPLLAASSWSFPSGHAMGTFILCGVGCYLLLRERRSWSAATILVTVTVLWCAVMAFSRLYLGVHFASDVVAGLLAGVAWVAVCVSAIEVIRRRSTSARSAHRRQGWP
jgi:membrane-associated phospholipid phosphatase